MTQSGTTQWFSEHVTRVWPGRDDWQLLGAAEQVPDSSQNTSTGSYFYRGDCDGFLFIAQMFSARRVKDSPTSWGVRQTYLHTLWVFDASRNSSLAHKYLRGRVHENQHFCYFKLTCVLLLFCMVNWRTPFSQWVRMGQAALITVQHEQVSKVCSWFKLLLVKQLLWLVFSVRSHNYLYNKRRIL